MAYIKGAWSKVLSLVVKLFGDVHAVQFIEERARLL